MKKKIEPKSAVEWQIDVEVRLAKLETKMNLIAFLSSSALVVATAILLRVVVSSP